MEENALPDNAYPTLEEPVGTEEEQTRKKEKVVTKQQSDRGEEENRRTEEEKRLFERSSRDEADKKSKIETFRMLRKTKPKVFLSKVFLQEDSEGKLRRVLET